MACGNTRGEDTPGGAGSSPQVARQAGACSTGRSGCPGHYEERLIHQTVRDRGELVVIDHVPADVCTECGDVLLKPETVERIEMLLQDSAQPAATAPVYEYA